MDLSETVCAMCLQMWIIFPYLSIAEFEREKEFVCLSVREKTEKKQKAEVKSITRRNDIESDKMSN